MEIFLRSENLGPVSLRSLRSIAAKNPEVLSTDPDPDILESGRAGGIYTDFMAADVWGPIFSRATCWASACSWWPAAPCGQRCRGRCCH